MRITPPMHLLLLYFPLHQYTPVMMSQVIVSSASLPVQHVYIQCPAYKTLVRESIALSSKVFHLRYEMMRCLQTLIHCKETLVKYCSYKQTTVLEDYFKLLFLQKSA